MANSSRTRDRAGRAAATSGPSWDGPRRASKSAAGGMAMVTMDTLGMAMVTMDAGGHGDHDHAGQVRKGHEGRKYEHVQEELGGCWGPQAGTALRGQGV